MHLIDYIVVVQNINKRDLIAFLVGANWIVKRYVLPIFLRKCISISFSNRYFPTSRVLLPIYIIGIDL